MGIRALINLNQPWRQTGGNSEEQRLWPLSLAGALTVVAILCANLPNQDFFPRPEEYLPVHTILEFFAIVVSAMVCGLGWNLRQQRGNSLSVVLASAFLAVAAVDLVHTLSYMGMPFFVTPSGPEKAINFWLAGRILAAIGLLCIAILPVRRWSPSLCIGVMVSALATTIVICWVGLWHADWLPRTFISGRGLTLAKIGTEYALMVAYGSAALLLLWRYRCGGTVGQVWLAAASWTLGLGESFFTLYSSVTDLFNLLGHVYKAVAYLMIYRALFVEGVKAPYRTLALERAHLQALLATIPDLVWLKDVNGIYLSCDPEFGRFFGASEARIVGKTDYDFVDGQLADFFRQKDREAMAAGIPTTNDEWVAYACDGHRALLETTKTPMFSAAGQLIGVLGIARDITARVRTEATLKKANEDLEQFAYVASHDLREPLRMVSGYISMLDRRYGETFDADGREFMGYVREGARRMDRMVLDLLEYSRIGRPGDGFASVPLAEVIGTAIANLDVAIEETKAKISVSGTPPVVMGARGELVRLVQNLIDNALKYRAPGRSPVISIGCVKCEEGWRCTVSDNGIGIAPEYFERIFAIFQRLHTREKYEGTGIGLAICKKIIEHHGGRIWVESRQGVGSTFLFTLPGAPATE